MKISKLVKIVHQTSLMTLSLMTVLSLIGLLVEADVIMFDQSGMPTVLDDDREVILMPGQQSMMISDDDFFL